MNSPTTQIYVEGNRIARAVTICFTILFFITGFVLHSYNGAPAELSNSVPHYLALWVVGILMWIAAIYCVYLVVDSVGTGGFPGPTSKLPVRSRLSSGVIAILYRCIMIAAAICLIAFPIAVIWYVGNQTP